MSAHAELAEVQTAIPSARGARLGELLGAEKRLIEEQGAALMGPLAELAGRWQGWFGWRDGWLDRVESPPISSSSRDGKHDPLPRALLTRAIDAGVLDRCRAIAASRWPKRLPAATEELTLQQAVITDRLLAHEKLRTLRVHAMVASPPLRHTGLTRLETHCMGPVIDVLESAELPSLEELHLSGIGQFAAPADRLGAALRRLPARRLTLGILGRSGRTGWTDEEARALSPVADRITGLTLESPLVTFDVALPNLRRLCTSTGFRGPTAATGFVWPDLAVDELHVFTRSHNIDFADLIRSFHRSPLARRLRVLHWEFSVPAMAALADRPFESLEELSLLPTDTMKGVPTSDAIIERGQFPNVRTMSLAMPQQIPALAGSPLASQLEVLSAPMLGGEWLAAWVAARPRFPRLRTLVARGWSELSIDERVTMTDGGHDVIWAEPDRAARRRVFDAHRGAPGMPRLA